MQVTKIADNLLLLIGEAYHANSLVFLRGNDALLVEAMGSRADGEGLRHYVERVLGKRVRLIVSTHYFADHMAALGLFPEADIITHEGYLETWNSERYRSEEELAHFVEPTITVGDRMSIRWGAHRLDVFHNPGHTASSLAVDVPTADLLHVSDTIVGNIVYFAYTTPDRLAVALDELRRRGRQRILASHGAIVDPVALENAASYLGAAVARPRRNAPLADYLPEGVPPADFESIFHQRNMEQLAS